MNDIVSIGQKNYEISSVFFVLEASLVSVNRCRISRQWPKTKTQFDRYCVEHHTSQPLAHRNPTNAVRHSQQRWVFRRQYAGSLACCACTSIITPASMEARVHAQYLSNTKTLQLLTGQCRSEKHTVSSFCGSKMIIWIRQTMNPVLFLFSLTHSPLKGYVLFWLLVGEREPYRRHWQTQMGQRKSCISPRISRSWQENVE